MGAEIVPLRRHASRGGKYRGRSVWAARRVFSSRLASRGGRLATLAPIDHHRFFVGLTHSSRAE